MLPRNKVYVFFAALFIMPLFLSCTKLSDNGPIDGKWQLKSIYSKTDKESSHYTEFHNKQEEGIYWIFQLNLLNIKTMIYAENILSTDIIARFNINNDLLHVGPTYVHFRERDSLLTDPNTTLLEPIGIRGISSTYKIIELNSNNMILCSSRDSLVFKKI